MKYGRTMSGIACLLAATAVFAVNPSQPLSPKKQLITCMNKQMAVNHAISYYEAMKSCKQLIKSQEESLVAVNEAKPAIAR